MLDDSTDDTAPFAEALVERYRTLGYPIEYHHRTNRHGFKAGALQEGLKTATGELVAVFDADFIPPPDFLMRTIHYFADPKVGVVQTRWSYLNRDYNFLTEVEAHAAGRPLHPGARRALAAPGTSSTSTARPAFCAAR